MSINVICHINRIKDGSGLCYLLVCDIGQVPWPLCTSFCTYKVGIVILISWHRHEDEISSHIKCSINAHLTLTAIILKTESTERGSSLSSQVFILWSCFRWGGWGEWADTVCSLEPQTPLTCSSLPPNFVPTVIPAYNGHLILSGQGKSSPAHTPHSHGLSLHMCCSLSLL